MSAVPSQETVGLIGAGLMGAALAERLLAAGFGIVVWDREPARVLALAGSGAEVASDAMTVATIRASAPSAR